MLAGLLATRADSWLPPSAAYDAAGVWEARRIGPGRRQASGGRRAGVRRGGSLRALRSGARATPSCPPGARLIAHSPTVLAEPRAALRLLIGG